MQLQVVWNQVGSACQYATAHIPIVMKPQREKENKIKEHGSSKTQCGWKFCGARTWSCQPLLTTTVLGEASESLSERVPQLRDWEGVGARCGACESKGVQGKWHGVCKGKLGKPTDESNRKEDIHPLQQVSSWRRQV